MLLKAVVALVVVALLVGAGVAAFLVGRSGDGAPSEALPEAATGTAVAVATAAEATAIPTVTAMAAEPELFVSQVIGMRGCDQPIFVTGGGFPARTRVHLERVDDGQAMTTTTSDTGFVALDARGLFTGGCQAGAGYALRLVEAAEGRELARSEFEAAVFPGTIEVEPASGGCSEIVVTVRGMPAESEVSVFVAEPAPFAHNFASIVWAPVRSDNNGVAHSAPFSPPWSCETAAVSLFAAAGPPGPVHAELLYRIALGPGEPVPSVERWLASMGR